MTQETQKPLTELVAGDLVALPAASASWSSPNIPSITHFIQKIESTTAHYLILAGGRKVSKAKGLTMEGARSVSVVHASPELVAQNAAEKAATTEAWRVHGLCMEMQKRLQYSARRMTLKQIEAVAALESEFQKADADAAKAASAGQ